MMSEVELRLFFERMISGLREYFKDVYKQGFTNQTVASCMAIYNLCKEENPDQVVEIGTNHGASTFALAMAVKLLEKDLSLITTIDLDHEKWKESFNIHKDLLKEQDLNLGKIKTLTANFNDIDPETIIDPSKKTFVFYDMHDHTGPWSQRLLDLWVPLVKTGAFSIHDITPVQSSFEVVHDEISPRTKILCSNGQYYAGFNECFRIIKWANSHNINIRTFPGGVYFKNG